MKKISVPLAIVSLTCFLFCCCNKKEKLLRTTFSGRAFDVTRNKPVQGYKVEVNRVYDCSSGGLFSQRTCSDLVGSVLTNANGNFSMEFDALPDGKYYSTTFYQPPYNENLISGSENIKPGGNNILNLDVWYPVILKASLNITNSIYPPLTINTYANNSSLWNESIYGGPSITKTVYLKAKPNALNKIIFSYTTSAQANFSHQKPDSVFVNLQDTFQVSYNIDCSTF